MRTTKLPLLCSLLLAAASNQVLAEENWGLCAIPSIQLLPETDLGAAVTRVQADSLRRQGEEKLYLEGAATVRRDDQSIQADNIVIDQKNRQLSASGEVIFQDRDIRLLSPSIQLDEEKNTGNFASPEFQLPSRHARGQADAMVQLNESQSLFTNLMYTSCDPDDRDWHLRANKMLLDDASGRGSATHTFLYFKEVPFLYLPYFQFPIDDRRMTGLLTPTIGYSEADGLSVVAPVYLNLAPNYDATITPATYANRGLQANLEGRYLFSRNSGILEYSVLDDDEFGDERNFQRWRHTSRLPFNITGNLLLVEASDEDFFDDFEFLAPEYEDDSYLERFLKFDHGTGSWRTQLLWQDYQTLDEDIAFASRPYQRSPQLSISGSPPSDYSAVQYDVIAEWTAFEKEESITGQRLHFSPSVSLNYADSWYFFNPVLQANLTDYRLSGSATDDEITRALPTLSLDSGLIFERIAGSQDEWLQTLEPRLYFLYTPFEDQQDIPDFDTSTRSTTYANLFRNNRFSGYDRIGDARQVTAALATRLFDQEAGRDVLRARAAQIFYGADREVSLNNSVDTAATSDLIAELDYWPMVNTRMGARFVVDEASRDTNEETYTVNYADNQARAANLEYYFKEDSREQVLFSVAMPINERWAFQGKTQHSLRFNEVVENIIGLSYESCCWGLKIVAQQEADAEDDYAELDTSIYFELTLKGLSQAGRDVDSLLRQSIPGYQSGF